MKSQSIITPLLAWYDRHARTLPWRVRDALEKPDPYRVWLSEIMLQQTTVPAVMPYFARFTERYPSVHDLANASSEDVMRDWAGLGYYSRARNLHACAKTIAKEHNGVFPDSVDALKKLPGIGDYTAGAIAAIAFDKQATVVDGNVERVVTRLFAIETPLPLSKPAIKAHAHEIYHDAANTRPRDLPQAFMDLGATVCTPTRPKCPSCPLEKICQARKHGLQETLPKRARKPERPKRQGLVYWVENAQGHVLMQRRPAKGLLGGMSGLPTSDWNNDPQLLAGFLVTQTLKTKIKHVFTHFELTLTPVRASVEEIPPGYYFADPTQAGLPSVFMKAVNLFKSA